jgi:ferrochelatase
MILPGRSPKSAAKYAGIWTPEGSPLLVYTKAQTAGLQARLPEAKVVYAMRYGHPNVSEVLNKLAAEGFQKALIVPLYPQYSSTTIGSVYEAVASHIEQSRNQLELKLLRGFYTDAGYLDALAHSAEAYWAEHGRPGAGDKVLLSFHSIPVAVSDDGDPYKSECEETAREFRKRLGLSEENCLVTFQSKFGPSKWLTPATIDTVTALGSSGVNRIDVLCPAFVSDCLESLEEIEVENREAYQSARKAAALPEGTFHRIPCLNADPEWLAALANVVRTSL